MANTFTSKDFSKVQHCNTKPLHSGWYPSIAEIEMSSYQKISAFRQTTRKGIITRTAGRHFSNFKSFAGRELYKGEVLFTYWDVKKQLWYSDSDCKASLPEQMQARYWFGLLRPWRS